MFPRDFACQNKELVTKIIDLVTSSFLNDCWFSEVIFLKEYSMHTRVLLGDWQSLPNFLTLISFFTVAHNWVPGRNETTESCISERPCEKSKGTFDARKYWWSDHWFILGGGYPLPRVDRVLYYVRRQLSKDSCFKPHVCQIFCSIYLNRWKFFLKNQIFGIRWWLHCKMRLFTTRDVFFIAEIFVFLLA